jgi:VanZ family protein
MPESRRSFSDRLLWYLGSFQFLFFRRSLWKSFRRWREEKLIRKLLITYPGLADRPRSEQLEVSERIFASLEVWRIKFLSIASAIAAAYATTPILMAVAAAGIRLPQWSKIVIVVLAAGIAGDLVRRWFINRYIDRAVAEVYPTQFCKCGYCLIGLPPGSRCPECGVAISP